MEISSNRSPSPILSRTNPNSRTQESSSSIRKSFSGNPFTRTAIVPNHRSFNPVTPANSPADFTQKNSGYREGLESMRISCDQKENEKDHILKPVRVRSPTVSKGTKNFMSPTISAASKINASPRKKVLTERNEAVRTSITLSDGKPTFCAVNLPEFSEEIGSKSEKIQDSRVLSESKKKTVTFSEPVIADSENKDAVSIALSVPETSKSTGTPKGDKSSIPVSDGNPSLTSVNPVDLVEMEELGSKPGDFLNSPVPSETHTSICDDADLVFKVKPSSSPSPVLAPLDIDPSLPPYDPKTNYLSPRPQFLHYRPNPRIEIYLNKEQDFDPGEGKRLEDRFTSESCSESENSEESQLPDSQNVSEDACSSEMIHEEVNEKPSSEPEPNTIQKQKVTIIVNEVPKSHAFPRSKSISLLLVLVIACLSFQVTDSPILSPSLIKTDTFFKLDAPAKVAELAKTKLDELAYDVRVWSFNSFTYLSNLISIPRVVEEIGPIYFLNSTSSDEEHLVDVYQPVDFGYKGIGPDPGIEGEIEKVQEEEPIHLEIEAEDNIKEEVTENPSNVEVTEEYSNAEFEEQSPLLPEAPPKISETEASEDVYDIDSHTNNEPTHVEDSAKSPESDDSYGTSQGLETLESALPGSEYKFPAQNLLGISSVVLTLIAATAFLVLKQNKASSPEAVVVPVAQVPMKKFILSPVSASSDHPYHERSFLRNGPTEVEMVGEPGPSEMSSTFQESSYWGRNASERVNEAQSHERKLRRNAKRESMASSSDFSAGSPSYGSFTTYEKLHNKHGSGDEEMVTPVRRSSRIRKQITSP